MVIAHSLIGSNRIKQLISSIPPPSLPSLPGFIITPDMETQTGHTIDWAHCEGVYVSDAEATTVS